MKTIEIDGKIALLLENIEEVDSIAAILRSQVHRTLLELPFSNDSFGLRYNCSLGVQKKYDALCKRFNLK
jgi:hypothetical protein